MYPFDHPTLFDSSQISSSPRWEGGGGGIALSSVLSYLVVIQRPRRNKYRDYSKNKVIQRRPLSKLLPQKCDIFQTAVFRAICSISFVSRQENSLKSYPSLSVPNDPFELPLPSCTARILFIGSMERIPIQ